MDSMELCNIICLRVAEFFNGTLAPHQIILSKFTTVESRENRENSFMQQLGTIFALPFAGFAVPDCLNCEYRNCLVEEVGKDGLAS